MSLSPEDLIKHCKKILTSPKSKNIVVLCEGEGGIWDTNVRETVATYGRLEQMPDANFYKKCVPKTWSRYKPEFFNCGDRKDVIDTYLSLLELCSEYPENERYLKPEKLFAIVDLDLQKQTINNYAFPDTETIFCNLYQKGEVNEQNAEEHRIWVTGLIHKEAYFIIPELQYQFDNYLNTPIYNAKSLVLEDIYLAMADSIVNDADLKSNLPKVSNRINHCSGLDCIELENLRNSWKEQFQNAEDDTRKSELIFALLTFKKAKDYWKQIQPPNDWTSSKEVFRDQLLLKIAKFYSEQTNYTKYHIPYFIQILKKFI